MNRSKWLLLAALICAMSGVYPARAQFCSDSNSGGFCSFCGPGFQVCPACIRTNGGSIGSVWYGTVLYGPDCHTDQPNDCVSDPNSSSHPWGCRHNGQANGNTCVHIRVEVRTRCDDGSERLYFLAQCCTTLPT